MGNLIQDVLNMKANLLAYHSIVKGEFDKEIARLEALTKEIEGKMGIIKTIDAAKSHAASVIAKAESVAQAAEAKAKAVDEAMIKAAATQDAADQKSNLARTLELEVQSGWNDLVKAKDAHALHVASTTANLAQAQADLNKSAAQVASQQAAVDAKAIKIADALKSA